VTPKLLIGLAVLAGLYAAVCLVMFFLQSRLMYFPDSTDLGSPDDLGLSYRDVTLRTEDGLSLHGWFLPGEAGNPALLFCHGNAGNITGRLESLAVFRRMGLSVLIFDYRGYGTSEGSPSEGGTYADATAAWRYLTEEAGFDSSRVVVFGRSLGGAVAVELATRVNPMALIVESSFTSAPALGQAVYPWLPVRLLARIRYDSGRRIGTVTCPVLVVHSSQDEVVPYSFGRRLFELANEPKRFLEIRGGHNDGFAVTGDDYVRSIAGFIAESSGGSPGFD